MAKTKSTNQPGSKKEDPQPAASKKPDPRLGVHLVETAWRIAVPFLLLTLGGAWLDERYDSDPMFVLIGFTLSVMSVVVMVYKYVETNFPGTFKRGDED